MKRTILTCTLLLSWGLRVFADAKSDAVTAANNAFTIYAKSAETRDVSELKSLFHEECIFVADQFAGKEGGILKRSYSLAQFLQRFTNDPPVRSDVTVLSTQFDERFLLGLSRARLTRTTVEVKNPGVKVDTVVTIQFKIAQGKFLIFFVDERGPIEE